MADGPGRSAGAHNWVLLSQLAKELLPAERALYLTPPPPQAPGAAVRAHGHMRNCCQKRQVGEDEGTRDNKCNSVQGEQRVIGRQKFPPAYRAIDIL